MYEIQLQKTIVLRMQPRHQATLTQPLQCDLQRLSCKTQKNFTHWQRQMTTIMQPFQCDLPPQLQETHRTTHTGTTTRCKTHRRNHFATETTPAAPAAHTRFLSLPAAATLHGKTQGFVLRLPPQHKPHATFIQPFQCDLPPQRQKTHRPTHTGITTRCKTHRRNHFATKTPAALVAHTTYLSSPAKATLHGKTQGFVPRLHPQIITHATFMQPFQCDLPPQLQKTHRTTHTGTTIRCKTHRRNHFATETTPAAPAAAHTTYLSSPADATLHGKTQGFVPRLPPHNKAHVTFMQSFQCDLPSQLQETYRTTHTGTTSRYKTHRRNNFATERTPAAPVAHTRYL